MELSSSSFNDFSKYYNTKDTNWRTSTFYIFNYLFTPFTIHKNYHKVKVNFVISYLFLICVLLCTYWWPFYVIPSNQYSTDLIYNENTAWFRTLKVSPVSTKWWRFKRKIRRSNFEVGSSPDSRRVSLYKLMCRALSLVTNNT